MLLLLLSRFSRVQLCANPQTEAHQAPPSLGCSRQEHWSGLPFPFQCIKVKSEREVTQSCPTLSDPMDCSLLAPPSMGYSRQEYYYTQMLVYNIQCSISCFILPTKDSAWRRQWQPTPVLLPGKSHGRRSLVGCSPWGRQESDTTERLHFHIYDGCFL